MNDLRLKKTSSVTSLRKSIFTQPPDLQNRICYGAMVSYETYEPKKCVRTQNCYKRKENRYVELLHDIIPLTRKRYGHLS